MTLAIIVESTSVESIIVETCIRTTLLIAIAGLTLALLRVRSSSVMLAVWRLVLIGCLLMPLASLPWQFAAAPKVTLPASASPIISVVSRARATVLRSTTNATNWPQILRNSYGLVAGLLLLRAALGLLRVRALTKSAVSIPTLGNDIVESPSVRVPVTCGAKILLPNDWREWTAETLGAVLAHERNHVSQHDFLTQTLSRVNCSLQWCNPLSWWLHSRLVALAEEVSDDAALNTISEPPSYAALLLGFAGRGERLTSGVAMARQAPVAGRIERILDEARVLSRPLGLPRQFALATAVFTATLIISACRMTTVSAQTKTPKSESHNAQNSNSNSYYWNDSDRAGWAIINPNGSSTSGSGPMGRALMAGRKMSGPYVWFTINGEDYLIEDAATLSQIHELLRPQQEIGRRQGELGERQGALGEQMGKLGEQMGKLSERIGSVKVNMPKLKAEIVKLQAEIERLEKSQTTVSDLGELQGLIGELQARIGDAQGAAGDIQSKIGDQQTKLGEEQAKLGEQQSKLGDDQGRLGEQQAELAREAAAKIRRLFEQAVKDGRANPVR